MYQKNLPDLSNTTVCSVSIAALPSAALLGRHCSASLLSGCGTLFSLKRIMDLIHKMFKIVSPLMSINFGHDGSVNGENLKLSLHSMVP